MLLPLADDAEAWFVEVARVAVAAGQRLDPSAVELLLSLAPGEPFVAAAIDLVATEPATLAGYARAAARNLHAAAAARDEAAARDIVSALELEMLRVYRPSHGLGTFRDDVAAALAMLGAYDVGADQAHLMMAEELLLGIIRREWPARAVQGLDANAEAAIALAALAERTGKDEYRERALEVMRDYAESYRDHGVRAAAYIVGLRALALSPQASSPS